MVTAKNTARIKDRRRLRFDTPDEALQEAERLMALEASGRLEALGNWTLGQALGHLATWIGFSYTKPPLPPPPLPIRLILRLLRRRIIYGAMPAGVKVRGAADGTVGTELMSTSDGWARFESAWQRLVREPPSEPSAAFGRLTHEQAIHLNLRHAELHLGFFREKTA
jgi:hypothetical protein